MCEAVGHPVVELQRIAIGPLELGRLKSGGHRRLHAGEVDELRAAANRG
jgi:16S rRNA U516 pseudouridylate synthase RsuA-like enzyme